MTSKKKSFFTTIVRESTKVKSFFKKRKKLENVLREEEKYVFVEKQSISKLTHLKSCLSRIDICPKRTSLFPTTLKNA